MRGWGTLPNSHLLSPLERRPRTLRVMTLLLRLPELREAHRSSERYGFRMGQVNPEGTAQSAAMCPQVSESCAFLAAMYCSGIPDLGQTGMTPARRLGLTPSLSPHYPHVLHQDTQEGEGSGRVSLGAVHRPGCGQHRDWGRSDQVGAPYPFNMLRAPVWDGDRAPRIDWCAGTWDVGRG